LGEVGTVLGIGCKKGSIEHIGKTYWTKLTLSVEEDKKGVSYLVSRE